MHKRLFLAVMMAVLMLAGVLLAADETAKTDSAAVKPGAPRVFSVDEAKAISAKDGRPIVLDFYTDW